MGDQFPCGQCHNCRINRKREWQARLLLEAATSEFSAFVTFTLGVDDANKNSYCTYLDKRTVQLFLKRLRKAVFPVRVRYLIVGEYGEKYGRAHYHALMFSTGLLPKSVLAEAWKMGSIDIGDVQQESIDYVLAYVLKRSSVDLDGESTLEEWDRLRRERHPEFRLHSQGLGRAALPHLAVPDRETGELRLRREFRVLGRTWPVSRYYRQRWRGASATALHEQGLEDPVALNQEGEIERMLYEELRSLPYRSDAYFQKVREIRERREKVVKELQKRRVRDYYRDKHRHNRRSRNETF